MACRKTLIAGSGCFLVLALAVAIHVYSYQNWLETATNDFSDSIYSRYAPEGNVSLHNGLLLASSLGAPTTLDDLSLKEQEVEEKNMQQCNMLYLKDQEQPCQIQSISWDENCRPNYFIAGTRKGGTTSMHTYMAAHPNVFPFKIHGKPQDGELLGTPIEELKSYFATLPIHKDQIVGEASVKRIINDSWRNLADFGCKTSRIFLLLRDPVERCHSQMLMRHRRNSADLRGRSVSAVIATELQVFKLRVKNYPNIVTELWDREDPLFFSSKNCLFEGAYVVHLRRLLHRIPRERIRIYWSDDFFADPAAVVRDALSFVGEDAAKMDLQKVVEQKFNAKPKYQSSATTDRRLVLLPELRKQMEEAMEPFNRELAVFLGQTPPWMIKNAGNNSTQN